MRKRRGGASVAIAIMMAMIIVTSFVSNILIWNNRLNIEEEERLAEKFTIKSVFLSNQSNLFQVNVVVENSGGVLLRLVSLYINTTRYRIDVLLDPVRTTTISQNLTSNPEIDNYEVIFDVTLTSERGSIIYYSYVPEPPSEVKDTGVFKLDWFYFKYTSYQNPSRTDGMIISKSSTYVAVYFKVTNNWIYPTTIKAETFATWIVPYIEVTMSIVDHVTYPGRTITAYTNEIVVQPGQTVELIFAATANKGTSWVWGSSIPSNLVTQNPGSTAYVQLTLFYTLLSKTYCQTLAAQGTYLS